MINEKDVKDYYENNDETKECTDGECQKETEVIEYETLVAENQKLVKEIDDLKNNIELIKEQQKKLILATKVNTLKEQEIQNEDFKKYAVQKLIEYSILPVLLNFERALNFKTDNQDVKNFLIGFKYIFNELKTTLEKEGLKTIEIKTGQMFDSKIAQVLEVEEIEAETKEQKDNMVTAVLASGYQLHNRVIAPVQVKILKLKTKENK